MGGKKILNNLAYIKNLHKPPENQGIVLVPSKNNHLSALKQLGQYQDLAEALTKNKNTNDAI